MTDVQEHQPNPVPINGLFVGDIVSHLVVVLDTDTIAQLAEKVAEHSVGIKVAPREGPMVVYLDGGDELPLGATVAASGIRPMQFVTVKYAS